MWEAARQPIVLTGRSRRSFDERFGLRFPRAFAVAAHAAWRLPLRSRMRRTFLGRAARLGYDASNRGDQQAAFLLFHPDCRSTFSEQLASFGETGTTGREERIRWQETWRAEWREFRFEPEELIDLGNRQLVLGRIRSIGLSSGAGTDTEWAVLFTSSAGRVVREQVFLDHAEAIAAAGLRE